MPWRAIERPGQLGKKRDTVLKGYDERYGKENWRLVWNWEGDVVPFSVACMIYEDGYYADSFKREELWKELASVAKDVYDQRESDIKSDLDYAVQKGPASHLQDISIRRVMKRRNWKFEGTELIQIRSHNKYWGGKLSPGRVPFHMPEQITEPHLEGGWNQNSIEDFYQSNKVLQVLYP
jgi:hypothetical protein